MHGWIFDCLKKMILKGREAEVWDEIRTNAKLDFENFELIRDYPDRDFFNLINSTADVLKTSDAQVFDTLGGFFLSFIRSEGFGDLLSCLGNSLRSFINNVKEVHETLNKVKKNAAFNFPEIFVVDDPKVEIGSHDSFILTYKSFRDAPITYSRYLKGIVNEAAKYFSKTISWCHLGAEWEDQKYTAVWRIQNIGR